MCSPYYLIMNAGGECIAATEFIKEAEAMAFECGGYYTTEWDESDDYDDDQESDFAWLNREHED